VGLFQKEKIKKKEIRQEHISKRKNGSEKVNTNNVYSAKIYNLCRVHYGEAYTWGLYNSW